MPGIFAAIRVWISNLARIGRSALGREQYMVRIRLRRQGSKGQPSYRVVVIDQRKARNGRYLENIGHYNPRTRPATEIIKEDRALYWLSVGAQPSDAVRRIMDHTGTWERFQRLRTGESIESLLKEAEENREELPSPVTNYPAPGDGESKIKARDADRLTDEESKDNTDEPSAQSQDESTTHVLTPHDLHDSAQRPNVTDDMSQHQNDRETEGKGDRLVTDETMNRFHSAERVDQESDDSIEETHTEYSKTSGLFIDMDRLGQTQLSDVIIPPTPLPNPEFRSRRIQEELEDAKASEPDKSERIRQVSRTKWECTDPATREFLYQQYHGKCQICGENFLKRDGKPYFEAIYLESRKKARWLDRPGNSLCLCANHAAQFIQGARQFIPSFREQVMSYQYGKPVDVKLTLVDEHKTICFTQRHMIDLKAILESEASDLG